ncbi:MAG: HAMP domain-containing histidine kinase [Cellulomonas sp.]|uniref:sensor histidine kinase n=1 Tax=Cellulomonas sp. TaxID=40001 RepID=UPI00185C290F|nr:HAMP domain-containing sensor histidine kinase [Cellulomonas sp.]NMM18285.1 HAMP domain-containing histidine kinase [Cellulomonas sp.]NMM31750.1 HAMP domain-containing histidine kinase [Cellulomonas sp.]
MRRLQAGVRSTTTLATTAAVAVILTTAGLSLIAMLRTDLTAGVDASVQSRAHDVTSLLNAGSVPAVIPTAQDDSSVVQVIDAAGSVLAASGNIQGEAALTRPTSTSVVTTLSVLPIGEGERFRILAQPVGSRTVVVAQTLGPVDRAVARTSRLLLEVLPFVLVLVAVVTWLGVGRALAPLEQIRRKTATIGAGDLSQRVPLPASRDEVFRLAETMNSMLARIGASTDLQRRFIADASHELRSPLANIQAVLEVARTSDELALWQAAGAELASEQRRMLRLVEDLLVLARLDGHVPVAQNEVDLDDIVHDEVEKLRRRVEIDISVDPLPAVRVHGDGPQLARVARNLLDNAARHAGSTVHVSLATEGAWAAVRVRDDGPGVPPKDRERVFERFTRLDDARARDRGGSGLGLAISRETALAHGGSLQVTQDTSGGAVFELRLPLWKG